MKIVIIALALLTSASSFAGDIKKAPPVTKAELESSKFVRVTGNSMKATMPCGSLWVAEPVKAEDCKVGDVVVFHDYRTDSLVVHRIVRKNGSFWVTKGDSNAREDLRVVSNKNLRLRVVAAPKLASK